MTERETMPRAPEPRVMTLEELKVGVKCWLERHDGELWKARVSVVDKCSDGIHGIFKAYDMIELFGMRVRYNYAWTYGKTWRCWTSRPTDEQREATPWK